MAQRKTPTGREATFKKEEIIVSKTDEKGRITYANQVFLKVSGFAEEEVIGAPHNLIRHPDMPRCVFKYLWEVIQGGDEIFAYVLNMCKSGDHYWAYGLVTPSYGIGGQLIGYHSSRRLPSPKAIETITPIYNQLLAEEKRHTNAKDGLNASYAMLNDLLAQQGQTYDQFVHSLGG